MSTIRKLMPLPPRDSESVRAPVGELRVAGPHLLAADDEVIAVARRATAQRAEIGAGVRLGEELTPQLAGVEDARQVTHLLRFAAVVDQRRPDEIDADTADHFRRLRPRQLFLQDVVLCRRGAAAAVLPWPVHTDPTAGRELPLPADQVAHFVRQ